MRRVRFSLLALAVMAACSPFDSSQAQPSGDGGVPAIPDGGPGTTGEAGVDPVAPVDPVDAGPDDARDLCVQTDPPPAPIVETTLSPVYQTGGAEQVYEVPFAMATTPTHLYWLAVLANKGPAFIAEQDAAYAGRGRVRVRRLDKRDGQSDALDTTSESALDASALAVTGQHVYWFRRSATATTIARLPLLCAPGTCLGELQTLTLSASFPFVEEAFGVGERIAFRAGGRVYLLTPGLGLADALVENLGPIPGQGIATVAATKDELFLARNEGPSSITRMPFATPMSTSVLTLDPPSSNDKGVSLMATDTRRVYALRPDLSVASAPLANPTLFKTWRKVERNGFAMATDARRVYIATPDAGGVIAYNKQTCTTRRLYAGNVWRVVADVSGVYWAEHASRAPNTGAVYRVNLTD